MSANYVKRTKKQFIGALRKAYFMPQPHLQRQIVDKNGFLSLVARHSPVAKFYPWPEQP